MRVDAWCSERQYFDHVAPIWLALDPSERGTFYVWDRFGDYARALIPDVVVGKHPAPGAAPVIVASFQDSRSMRNRARILVEHGSGQSYDGDPAVARHGSYSGGGGHQGTLLFLCPNEIVAQRWRDRYPGSRVEVVGSPRLDRWCEKRADKIDSFVAISFHADVRLCPESRWAFPHYRDSLAAFSTKFCNKVIGHAHPRVWSRLKPIYEAAGIEPVEHFDEVLARASLYVVDNSSTAYEFAATGRPVLLLNAPWYRREINHGLRFWDLIPGLQCDEPEDLIAMTNLALGDPAEAKETRLRAVEAVYPQRDGKAAIRSVAAIREVLATYRPSERPRAVNPYAPKRQALLGTPEPPAGGLNEVLDWVGNDPLRARAALRAERQRHLPRLTLIRALEELAA